MKCHNCSADLTNDTVKCPFCKELLTKTDNPKLDNCDFKYTIASEEDMNLLRRTMNEEFKKTSGRKKIFKKRFLIKKKKKNNRTNSAVNLKLDKNKVVSGFSSISPQNKMYIAFYGGILGIILLISLIVLCAGAFINRERTLLPVVYSKDNSTYLSCGKKPVLLTENTVDINSVSDSDDALALSEIIDGGKLVTNSENGMYTYYFENYDVKAKSGSLVRIFNGKKKTAVSTGVHNSYVLSPDGKSLLFLQSADVNGDMGNLCYWNDKMDEPLKIAVDIDKDTFTFSYDGNFALYIRNYNYTEGGGDLCFFDLKNSESESIVLDLGVKQVFGTDASENKIIYTKATENSDKMYDIYTITRNSEKVKVFEKAVKKPFFSEKTDKMLVYAYNDGRHCSLFSVNLKNNKSLKIASQMTTVIKYDDNFDKILYNKVYENSTIDCYLYTKGGKTLKLAENVKMVSSEFENANQFSVSDDLETAVYISGFNAERAGGKLYKSRIKSGEAVVSEIADDVYTCRISPDGKKIIYGKDYSKSRENFDLYIYKNENSILLEDGVEKSFFGITNDRNKMVFINDFDPEGFSGTLNVITCEGKVMFKAENCGAFSCVGEDGVVYFSGYNETDDSWTLSLIKKKSKKDIDSGVDGIIRY